MASKVFFIFFWCFIFTFLQGNAQSRTYTEKDVDAQSLLISAKQKMLLGKTEDAIKIYEKLLLDHNESTASYELSKIYWAKEDYISAENYAKRSYDLDPNNEWYLILYSETLNINGYHQLAAQLHRNYTQIHPKNEYHYLQASFQYLKAEEPKEAIKMLDQLENNIGISEEIAQRKFEIYDYLGKEKDALKELQKLSDKYPLETRYLHNIAGYLRSMGKENDANKIIAHILEINPNDETALLFSNSSGKNKDANYLHSLVPVIQDERINLDKKILEIIPYLSDYANNGDSELGKSLLDISLILDNSYRGNAKVKSILGDIYFYHKDFKNAAINYKASKEIDKSIWSVWSQLMISLSIIEDYKMLTEISDEAIEVFPNQPLSYFYNSLAFLEKGELSEAEASAREALMMVANNKNLSYELKLLLSRIKYEGKDFEKALSLINEIPPSYGNNNPKVLEHKGDVNFAVNKTEEAKAAWKDAIKVGGNEKRLNQKIFGQANHN